MGTKYAVIGTDIHRQTYRILDIETHDMFIYNRDEVIELLSRAQVTNFWYDGENLYSIGYYSSDGDRNLALGGDYPHLYAGSSKFMIVDCNTVDGKAVYTIVRPSIKECEVKDADYSEVVKLNADGQLIPSRYFDSIMPIKQGSNIKLSAMKLLSAVHPDTNIIDHANSTKRNKSIGSSLMAAAEVKANNIPRIEVPKQFSQAVDKTEDTAVKAEDTTVKAEDTVDTVDASEIEEFAGSIDNSSASEESRDFGTYSLDIKKFDDGRVAVVGIEPKDYEGIVTVPEGVTHIEKYAFMYCQASGYSIPNTVTYLGDSAFSRTSVKNMTLPDSITAIPHNCFFHSKIEHINLENIKSIGNEAFYCSDLEEANLTADIAQVGKMSFCGCKKLTSVKQSGTIKKVRERAFDGCIALTDFDVSSVKDFEEKAFIGVPLKKVIISNECTAIRENVFESSDLEEVVLGENVVKLGDGSFSNVQGKPVVYTIPGKSLLNVGKTVFKECDTVRCCHNTVAESMAALAGATIEYLDNDKVSSMKIVKASMIGGDIGKIISGVIAKAYNAEDAEYSYDLTELTGKELNIPISAETLEAFGIAQLNVTTAEEKPKFKVLLDHFRKACALDMYIFKKEFMGLKNTYAVKSSELYNDGVSRIIELSFIDHKFESKQAKAILLLTGNNLRYCCLNNRYTNVYCKNNYSKDLSELLKYIVPGDVIGETCTIGGVKQPDITGDVTIQEEDADGKKISKHIKVNLYQAIFNCCIAVKLDGNKVAMILPANNTIIECANLGKRSVWANEKEDSYKHKCCAITKVQSLDSQDIIAYGAPTPNKDDALFCELASMSSEQLKARESEYSNIGNAIVSPYYRFRDYCIQNGMKKLEDMDVYGIGFMMAFPIVEQRNPDWLDKSLGKTIVKASRDSVYLSDGGFIRQYKTVKRVAMRNKLLTGGDREIYVFEIFNGGGTRLGVFASNVDIETMFSDAIGMVKFSSNPKIVYEDPDNFDTVPLDDVIIISQAFVIKHETNTKNPIGAYLVVYKPNGVYYFAYIYNKQVTLSLPIGDIDVIADYIDTATSQTAAGFNMMYSTYTARSGRWGYTKANKWTRVMLDARKLIIDGEHSTDKYLQAGLYPALVHMIGAGVVDRSLYNIPAYSSHEDDVSFSETDAGETDLDF